MKARKKLIIVGNTAFAEIAAEYFTHDSDYRIAGFSVEKSFRKETSFCGKPIVDFEELERNFHPNEHAVFVAVTYTRLNRLRSRLVRDARAKGYELASYISSRAFVWHNVEFGEHCFVFEDNTIQPFVKIDDNVVLWSGNHIGHHSKIGKNCFISSHVVISGYCDVGENSFLGVNSTVANNISISKDNWIGPGVTISRNTEPGSLYSPPLITPSKVSALRFFKIKD